MKNNRGSEKMYMINWETFFNQKNQISLQWGFFHMTFKVWSPEHIIYVETSVQYVSVCVCCPVCTVYLTCQPSSCVKYPGKSTLSFIHALVPLGPSPPPLTHTDDKYIVSGIKGLGRKHIYSNCCWPNFICGGQLMCFITCIFFYKKCNHKVN